MGCVIYGPLVNGGTKKYLCHKVIWKGLSKVEQLKVKVAKPCYNIHDINCLFNNSTIKHILFSTGSGG